MQELDLGQQLRVKLRKPRWKIHAGMNNRQNYNPLVSVIADKIMLLDPVKGKTN